MIQTLTEDVVRGSEIEGEILDRDRVRSSLALRLGLPSAAMAPTERRTEGVVDMTLDTTANHGTLLTAETLFAWQAALFPTGYSGTRKVQTGAWRDDAAGPMQVVSEPVGHQWVHHQVLPAQELDAEMRMFLDWFNRRSEPEGLLRAGLAHLWFVTIHPFEDGNGHIARAVTDQALAPSENSRQRFYSMSSQIRKERSDYYDALESAQKGTVDITDWLVWFLGCFSRTIDGAESVCADVLRRPISGGSTPANPSTNARRRSATGFLVDFKES